jgi:hypothetical protein
VLRFAYTENSESQDAPAGLSDNRYLGGSRRISRAFVENWCALFLVTTMVFGRFIIAVMIFSSLKDFQVISWRRTFGFVSLGFFKNILHLQSPVQQFGSIQKQSQ